MAKYSRKLPVFLRMMAIRRSGRGGESHLLIRRAPRVKPLLARARVPEQSVGGLLWDWVSPRRLVRNKSVFAPRTLIDRLAALAFAAALLASTPAFAQGRPDCATVLRKF